MRGRVVIAIGLLATLALLLAHAWHHWFLTDDAFISFRYARNLADGHGLVMNPGEWVEGYTNFLWVVLLAGLDALGLAPHVVANWLLLGATVILWGVVVWWAARGAPTAWALVPALLLAVTRSFAVWSTSGLETRLFELLAVAGVLAVALGLEAERAGRAARFRVAALLLALATLTRPDGLLVAAAVGLVAALFLGRRLGWRHLGAVGIYAAVVGAHLVWRRLTYDDWLPNTFYAKVTGLRWRMGFAYTEGFALEYGAIFWLPFLGAAIWGHVRRGTAFVPALFFAACLPHLAWVISIGGDHFEYRPLDLYLPFAFLLITDGARYLARGWRSGVAVAVGGALVVAGLVAIPWQMEREFPREYRTGYPGMSNTVTRETFGAPGQNLLGWFPGWSFLQRAWQNRLWTMTRSFAGLRREEHAAFLGTVVWEGKLLGDAVALGVLPADTYIATDCVGAIPYFSELRVLDRLGLTDRVVARQAATGTLVAHSKHASFEDAQARGVDLWAAEPVHLVYAAGSRPLVRRLEICKRCFSAPFLPGYVLVADLPQGLEAARARFPALDLRPAR